MPAIVTLEIKSLVQPNELVGTQYGTATGIFKFNCDEVPKQTVDGVAVAEILGVLLTTKLTNEVEVQPFISVPTTVYIVVAEGVATGLLIAALFKPLAGNQEYELAPVAVNVTPVPPGEQ